MLFRSMQDKSQAVQYYNDYLQKHPGSESMALVDTMMQQLARIGQAGLAGAVAGGMMGAAATVWRRAQIEQMGRAAQADAQAIVQEGLSYGEGTQAYQQAAEINQQIKEGEQPGDVQLGGLVEMNAATDLDQQQITSALESRDGQAVDNEGQAGYAGNKVEGEGIDRDTRTDSRGAEAPAEPTAPQTESVQQGESAEAESLYQGMGRTGEGSGSVKYYRVQTPEKNGSMERIIVNGDGTIEIATPGASLNLSYGTPEHAIYFKTLKGGDSYIVEFDIDDWFHNLIQENAIPQRNYRSNQLNQGMSAPKIVDERTPGNSMEFPPIWNEWFEENAKNARILN